MCDFVRKRLGIICSLFVIVLLLGACGTNGDGNSESAGNDKTWEKIQESGKLVVGTSVSYLQLHIILMVLMSLRDMMWK